MSRSRIEWTEMTWNPVVGCSLASPGCSHCYAMAQAHRIQRMTPDSHYEGTTAIVNDRAVWTGLLKRAPDRILAKPLRWSKPRMVFVNSMSDLFHEDLSEAWIDEVFAVMAMTPHHIYQVLTKRLARMSAYIVKRARDWVLALSVAVNASGLAAFANRPRPMPTWPLPNVWLGGSLEDQRRADERRPHFEAIAHAGWTTFASYEPALGPVDWTGWEWLSWLISGGESGPRARTTHPDWHRAARDFCQDAGIPYFFKQWGEYGPVTTVDFLGCNAPDDTLQGNNGVRYAVGRDGYSGELLHRLGKKQAGRLLDGRTWDEMPALPAAFQRNAVP